jgi:hypothetical protein
MKTPSIANSGKRLFTPVVLAAAFALPAFADYKDNIANTPQQTIRQPIGQDRAYMLPPLSDHIIVAMADEDAGALNDASPAARDDETALNDEASDDTATQYNRGYYEEPEQVLVVVLVPEDLETVQQQNISDDETAQQYDRGYYKDPETVAVVLVLNDEEEE